MTSRGPSPFLFRVGGRRKTSPVLATSRTTSPTTPSSTKTPPFTSSSSRLTNKFIRRKFPPPLPTVSSTSAGLESQETTPKITKPINNRYRFVSRRPYLKSTTTTSTTREPPTTEDTFDQTRESSNQQSLENFADNDTTELGDIASALQVILKAPLPVRPTTKKPIFHERSTIKIPNRSRVRLSTTSAPRQPLSTTKFILRRPDVSRPQAFEKINPSSLTSANTYRPLHDYDYYGGDESILGIIPKHSKVLLHSNGVIECLDQGSFPHPVSCKKFISCAKMENGKVLGWEYTCPKNLSFDPIGGMCNWSAGLGCSD